METAAFVEKLLNFAKMLLCLREMSFFALFNKKHLINKYPVFLKELLK